MDLHFALRRASGAPEEEVRRMPAQEALKLFRLPDIDGIQSTGEEVRHD